MEKDKRDKKTEKERSKRAYRGGRIDGYNKGKEKGLKEGMKKGYKEGVFDTLRCLFTKNTEEMKKIQATMDEDQQEIINNLGDMIQDIELHESNPKH